MGVGEQGMLQSLGLQKARDSAGPVTSVWREAAAVDSQVWGMMNEVLAPGSQAPSTPSAVRADMVPALLRIPAP